MSGPHFRDYHLHARRAGRRDLSRPSIRWRSACANSGQTTLTSIGSIAQLSRIKDNDADYVDPLDMLMELMEDNKACAPAMREAHKLCDDAEDSGTAGLLETFIDETEKRTWFLFEAARGADATDLRAG